MTFPAPYAWLNDLPGLPRMVEEGGRLYGLHEGAGPIDNDIILQWAKELGLGALYQHDSVAWCGLFMAHLCQVTGKPYPADPLWALNWRKFGTHIHGRPWAMAGLGEPSLGDVLVFERRSPGGTLIGGHVGNYIAEDADAFHVLGGNTADQVKIARLLKSRCVECRRPLYKTIPAAVKPYHVAATGALSTNEA
jgi:uncharacterized protein (TIGR02594 family)